MASAPSKLAIFVDGANLDISSRAAGIKIDYALLKAFLAGRRQIVLADYYNSKTSDPGERAFYSRIQNAGFTLVLGPRKVAGRPQKEVDVLIAVDMVSGAYSNSFDIALLVSGDGDQAPTVRKLRSMRKIIEVASFDDPVRKEFSMSLKSTASRTIDLTANMSRFKM